MSPTTRLCGVSFLFLPLAGCNRHQSALHAFGEEAAGVRSLTVLLVIGAAVILAAMLLLMWAAVRAPEGRLTLAGGERLILWAGGIVPAVLLLALLAYSLPLMQPRAPDRADLRIAVEGEQFWWRVRYDAANAPSVTSANEVRLPVGRTVVLRLTGGDVIHSFWIPGLAGKTDMIPGRENVMTVRATQAGRYRGQCTEFCGLSHALMAFDVVAMEPAAFDAWLAVQRRPAVSADPAGRRLFAQHGCGGCHTVRGSGEAGLIGPDLSHFGSRHTMAAGILQPTEANIAAFIRHPEHTKPGVRMPSFPHMPDTEARALARYLGSLR
ncbi:cytochrome c oxidase subunit II [uncultured Sphingomonas sp.]|uniref:cytochrome c oxidase subunit II n=1 Tax=uncultured Sphingomonas sp. TaxID=158754 RepID=UPI0025D86A3B|nr:cytochrome c oxidase subunit II [uncultured Sphingomonas sp.]